MRPYTQLSLNERILIDQKRQIGTSCRAIASILARSHSTITREIHRNKDQKRGYVHVLAESLAQHRKYERRSKVFYDSVLQKFVIQKLELGWSPQIIAGRLKIEMPNYSTCAESIYSFIYKSNIASDLDLYKLLRRPRTRRIPYGSRRKRGSTIPSRTSIHERPDVANNREEVGHWEGDLIINKGGNITVMIERYTRFLMARKNRSKHSEGVIQGMVLEFKRLPAKLKKSITFDQGTEFSKHQKLGTSQGIMTYFCDPYSPWQKGAVENANGRLRRWIPKKADISKLSQRMLDGYIELMNNTPRVCLGYKTPYEVFSACQHRWCTSS